MGLRSSWFLLPGYLFGVLLSFPAVGEAPRTLSPDRGGGLAPPSPGLSPRPRAVGPRSAKRGVSDAAAERTEPQRRLSVDA